ncbi:GNAT family N-acetyltransferase [Erythrobacter dokdonensis]|jgi:ribosomal-protein-alanine N-acetyltransferase|uniref:Acetyltransferase n=1 Tax=Erythrobacter dokdonensis DSW-74 TaxID=1300349 RepID=A0A1A7BI25_9SPHN|nr:GNAT family N-acetyltransferase [Erythrobacter dokdonensis]MEE4316408.1 GNAT family N-acetyltransferase [Erythrobacter sp.]OBV12134.1 Acetyltransferase [Erythrobacter dokdonensis DSW-74]
MTLRPLLVDRIMAVMGAAFDPAYGEAWNRRQVADALALPSTHALVVDADGAFIADGDATARAPAGFVLSRHVLDEEELLLIAVVPGARRRGIAVTLIKGLIDAARERGINRIYLEMRRGNPALHLYRKMGFDPIGERRNYYRMANGERIDAITFGRSI